MKYQIGDKFLVQNVPCEVKFINLDKAWVFPLEYEDLGNGQSLNPCVAFEVLDSKGKDSKGNKTATIVNRESFAV